MKNSKRPAPWRDFKGNKLREGDTIVHPSGETGVIIYDDSLVPEYTGQQWRVDYGNEYTSALGLQLGDKGQAVKLFQN